jgi:all-trans-retinol 13,14-reductase
LLGTVAEAGGWTSIVHDVAGIVIERGRAVGVRLGDGREIRARTVISAIGVGATAARLLPDELRETAWAKSVRALPPGPAHVCLYLGFRGNIGQAGAGAANRWFYETWDSEEDAWRVDPARSPGRAPVLYCSFPSMKDPHHDGGVEESHTGEVVTFVPWETFAPWVGTDWKRRPEGYDAFKQRLHDELLDHFFARMPRLKPLLHFSELSTPLSTDHFVRPQRGSIYGLLPTPERFRNRYLRPRAEVPGLFYAGSEVASVGVVGAMMGGALAAAAAAPRDVARIARPMV